MTDEQYKQVNCIRKYAHAAWLSLPDDYKDYWYENGTINFLQKIFELFGAEELWNSMTEEKREDLLDDSIYDL